MRIRIKMTPPNEKNRFPLIDRVSSSPPASDSRYLNTDMKLKHINIATVSNRERLRQIMKRAFTARRGPKNMCFI